jgi:hypothetical protein
MTLRMEQVAASLPAFVERYREQLEALDAGLHAAGDALSRWSDDPTGGDERIRAAMAESPQPYATSFGEPPAAAIDPPPFGQVTVVAADGSSIEPDRFAAVSCFVINTGSVVLPYGPGGDPVLESRALLGPHDVIEASGEDEGADDLGPAGWAVNLRRDVRELETAAGLASRRVEHGDVVVLVDGTLFPWDLDSRQVPERVRRELKERTQDALDLLAVQGEGLSLGAYISGSRSSEVVTSLRALAGDTTTAWPHADGHLFRTMLGDGQRSALFRAQSERVGRVEAMFTAPHQVCFFYLRVGDDVARVEVPHWATLPARVARLHATLVDQCRRCGGYPRALQEAHEQAVISTGDRLQFSRLLESEARRQGLHAPANSKQTSKRRRAL